ncbi:MAG: TIM barrel protein [Verrucomicrobia bacterium]|nr:TIM barrel protein [Verrucomicrobiota bacterium]
MNTSRASTLPRRDFLTALGGLGAFGLLSSPLRAADSAPASRPGRLRQGLCRGVFRGVKLTDDEMCREAARLGAVGIDLVGPEMFPTLKKYGLVPTMVPGGSGIKAGINDPKLHADIDVKMRAAIKVAAAAGAPNVIVLAGDRGSFTDARSMDHCAVFLSGIKQLAEDSGVTLCIELLNSKVNHPGYVCDHTAWGVELCKRVNSPRVKLLYDIYHMQIMEGDVIRTIQQNIAWIGHFHTAGNPGRHEFDETQEIYYPAVCKAIADLGYKGILSHEYTPTKDALPTLAKMMKLCEV